MAFQPPTEQEVAVLCREKGYTFSPMAFLMYYEARGWMLGKSPMKNWQAACVTWQLRQPGGIRRKPESGCPSNCVYISRAGGPNPERIPCDHCIKNMKREWAATALAKEGAI